MLSVCPRTVLNPPCHPEGSPALVYIMPLIGHRRHRSRNTQNAHLAYFDYPRKNKGGRVAHKAYVNRKGIRAARDRTGSGEFLGARRYPLSLAS